MLKENARSIVRTGDRWLLTYRCKVDGLICNRPGACGRYKQCLGKRKEYHASIEQAAKALEALGFKITHIHIIDADRTGHEGTGTGDTARNKYEHDRVWEIRFIFAKRYPAVMFKKLSRAFYRTGRQQSLFDYTKKHITDKDVKQIGYVFPFDTIPVTWYTFRTTSDEVREYGQNSGQIKAARALKRAFHNANKHLFNYINAISNGDAAVWKLAGYFD